MTAPTVNTALTPDAPEPSVVENPSYYEFARRIVRAYGRRVAASGDVDALTLLCTLSTDLDNAITTAVRGLRDFGYSWAEIGNRLGITRQAAQQRWGGVTT